jgi:hypothetical protein
MLPPFLFKEAQMVYEYHVSVRLLPDEYAVLERLSRMSNRKRSGVIRQLLRLAGGLDTESQPATDEKEGNRVSGDIDPKSD